MSAVCASLLLSACAAEGIFPHEALPPATPGPPAPYPSLNATSSTETDQRQILTEAEQAEMEARLTKLAKDREVRVRRRIEQAK
jgi:hypothetical protein